MKPTLLPRLPSWHGHATTLLFSALLFALLAETVLGGGGGGGGSPPPPPPPPPACGWNGWSFWSPADGCAQSRSNYCGSPSGCANGCQGQTSNDQRGRPITTTWGNYGGWSTWTTRCDYGESSRTRTCSCSNPTSSDGNCCGATCSGSPIDYRYREKFNAVNGGWTSWSDYDLSCGTRTRTRTCTQPSPSCGGAACPGNPTERTFLCCPVPATWTVWAGWTQWVGTCGSSQTRTKSRDCTTTCGPNVCPTGSPSFTATKLAYLNCCSGNWGRQSDNTCQPCSTCVRGFTLITSCQPTSDTVCRDITAPVVTLNPPNPQTQQAGVAWVDPGASATDVVDGTLTNIVRTPATVNVRQLGDQTIVYSATDAAGNTGSASRVVTVVDTLAPTLTLQGTSFMQWEANTTFVDPGCTAFDLLDLNVTVAVTGLPINTNILRNNTITYTACDQRPRPNCASTTRVVMVVQTRIPIITLLGVATVFVEAPGTYTDAGARVYDTLDGVIPLNTTIFFTPSNTTTTTSSTSANTRTVVPSVNGSVLGTYSIVYSTSNVRGLVAVPVTRTVIVRVTIAPNLTLFGSVNISHQGATPFVESGYSALSRFYGNVTNTVVVNGADFNIMSPAGSNFAIIYSVTDPSGNTAAKQRVLRIIDTVRPVLYLSGDATMVWQGAQRWVDPGYYANDTLDGDITSKVVITGIVDWMAPAGTVFTLLYTVQDAAGNSGVPLKRNVTIIDTIPPNITLAGFDSMSYESAVPWVDPGYYAVDALDGNITSRVNITGLVDVWAVSGSSFVLTYNVRDRAGNLATPRSRNVTMLDTIAPVITLRGLAAVNQEGATPWLDPGWSAFDNLNGNLTSQVAVGGIIDVDFAAGSMFTLNYTVSDAAGNQAIPRFRQVQIVDTTIPVIELLGPALYVQEASFPFVDPGARAWDTLDRNITQRIRVSGTVDVMAASGTNFTLLYNVRDASGLNATTVVRVVMIVDTIAPNVTIYGVPSLRTEGGIAYVDMGAQSHDLLDGDLTASIVDVVYLSLPSTSTPRSPMQPSNLPLAGNLSTLSVYAPLQSVYQIVYVSVDQAGNVGRAYRNVTIVNTQAPGLVLVGSPSVRLRQGSLYKDAGAVAVSRYFGDLTSSIVETVMPGGGSLSTLTQTAGTFEIVYTCVDGAGHVAEKVSRAVTILEPMTPSSQQAALNTYSSVNLQFDMMLSTPVVEMDVVGYKAFFVPLSDGSASGGTGSTGGGSSSSSSSASNTAAALNRRNNFTDMFAAAGIEASYVHCDESDGSLFPVCVVEAQSLTFADLDRVRAMNMFASISWTPISLGGYVGAVQLSQSSIPTSTVSVLLQQYEYADVTNLQCADGFCTFVSSTRGDTKAPTLNGARRRRESPEIVSLSLAPLPEPLMKRVFSLDFTPEAMPTVNQGAIVNAVQLARMQPTDVTCALLRCAIQTYDPVQTGHLSLLQQILPAGTVVSDITYFVNTEFDFPNPSGSGSASGTVAVAAAVEQGIAPHAVKCNATWCTLRTYAIASDSHVAGVRQAVVGGASGVAAASFSSVRVNNSAMPNLMWGWYAGTLSIYPWAGITAALYTANVTVVANITCLGSLVFDNALDCSFNVPAPMSDGQMFALLNYSGVLAATAPIPVALADSFKASLKRKIATLADVTYDRLAVVGVDTLGGTMIVDILPAKSNDFDVHGINTTVYVSSFVVANMSSVTLSTAQRMVAAAGIKYTSVSVEGLTVTFTAVNISSNMLANLANMSFVNASSITEPELYHAVLTHEEVAQMLLFDANNNMLSVDVGGRRFWAIPRTASYIVVDPRPKNLNAASSSPILSGSAMMGLIIAVVVGILVIALVAAFVVRRRRRQARNKAVMPIAAVSSSLNQFMHSTGNTHADSFNNPMYMYSGAGAASAGQGQGAGYASPNATYGLNAFANPMYDVAGAGFAADSAFGFDSDYQTIGPNGTVMAVPMERDASSGTTFAVPLAAPKAKAEFAVPTEDGSLYHASGTYEDEPTYALATEDVGYFYVAPAGESSKYGGRGVALKEAAYVSTDGQQYNVPLEGDGTYMDVRGVGPRDNYLFVSPTDGPRQYSHLGPSAAPVTYSAHKYDRLAAASGTHLHQDPSGRVYAIPDSSATDSNEYDGGQFAVVSGGLSGESGLYSVPVEEDGAVTGGDSAGPRKRVVYEDRAIHAGGAPPNSVYSVPLEGGDESYGRTVNLTAAPAGAGGDMYGGSMGGGWAGAESNTENYEEIALAPGALSGGAEFYSSSLHEEEASLYDPSTTARVLVQATDHAGVTYDSPYSHRPASHAANQAALAAADSATDYELPIDDDLQGKHAGGQKRKGSYNHLDPMGLGAGNAATAGRGTAIVTGYDHLVYAVPEEVENGPHSYGNTGNAGMGASGARMLTFSDAPRGQKANAVVLGASSSSDGLLYEDSNLFSVPVAEEDERF